MSTFKIYLVPQDTNVNVSYQHSHESAPRHQLLILATAVINDIVILQVQTMHAVTTCSPVNNYRK